MALLVPGNHKALGVKAKGHGGWGAVDPYGSPRRAERRRWMELGDDGAGAAA